MNNVYLYILFVFMYILDVFYIVLFYTQYSRVCVLNLFTTHFLDSTLSMYMKQARTIFFSAASEAGV